ncbi:MAG: hypothetical protein ACNI27_03885 [Desulfovibrio sp.]
MSTRKLKNITKALEKRAENSRTEALLELADLKKDIQLLERKLKGGARNKDVYLADMIQGMFELHRHASDYFEKSGMASGLAHDVEEQEAQEYLISRGAAQEGKPVVWSWESTKSKYKLGNGDEPIKAAKKLRGLLASGKRRKKVAVPK